MNFCDVSLAKAAMDDLAVVSRHLGSAQKERTLEKLAWPHLFSSGMLCWVEDLGIISNSLYWNDENFKCLLYYSCRNYFWNNDSNLLLA